MCFFKIEMNFFSFFSSCYANKYPYILPQRQSRFCRKENKYKNKKQAGMAWSLQHT